jgi:diguanylate cyclase (GGDEF)-like protein
MRVTLVATFVSMVALALGLAVVSGRIFRTHAIDSERGSIVEHLRIAAANTRRRFDLEATVLARALSEHSNLATASIPRSREELRRALERIPLYYALAAPGPMLVGLSVYDAKLEPLAHHAVVNDAADAAAAACQRLRGSVAAESTRAGWRLVSGYCLGHGRVYYATYVPIGDPAGAYLEVIADFASGLASIEDATGLPARLSLADGTLLAQSSNWPATDAAATTIVAAHTIDISGGGLVLEVVKDEQAFFDKLERTQYAVFFAAVAISLLVMLVALAFVEKTVIGPFRSLLEQLRGTTRDESQLGKRAEVKGNAEVAELARSFNDMTGRLEGLYQNLERMAFTDPLTQLPNRSLLQDHLGQAVAAARTDSRTLALFVMDLDRFKEINDTLGHHVGDALLQQVAIRLRAKLRDTDVIARTGGDEFAVIMPSVTRKQADMAARMLLQSLRAPFMVDGHHLDVGTSVGIALYPDHGVDAPILFQRADVAMYAAKQNGGGHMFYDAQMDRHHPQQLTLMAELRQAIEHEQFVLYYQPKIGLKTNRVVGMEALVRWRHPSGKLVMPETFIPILEQTGLIRSLTGWVTHEALRMARELRNRGLDLPIAVNISARDLYNSGLAEELAEHLAVHQAAAQWLELEITESAVMADITGAMELLSRLAGMGFKLVIDDFGTGYSSLAYLKRMPVNAVKIDKSFVMGMVKDENDAAIVYTSIDLSHNLGLQVVAEGVDDESVLFRLRSRGCDAAQGIYLSRPLPPEDLMDWLVKSTWGLGVEAAS